MNMRILYLVIGAWFVVWISWLLSVYSGLPDIIPTHFNAAGEVDGHDGKASIWMLPGIALFTVLMTLVLPQAAPSLINYPVKMTEENRARQYALMLQFLSGLSLIILALFTYISWITVRIATSGEANENLGLGVWLLLAPMFGWIFLYLYRSFSVK